MPTAIAAFVLFFFPVASHIPHPRSHYLKHYRVPIPWTVTTVAEVPFSVDAFVNTSPKARFGVTPFWGGEEMFSMMTFDGQGSDPLTFVPSKEEISVWPEGITRVSRRAIRVGNSALTCWQYLAPLKQRYRGIHPWQLSGDWQVHCGTPPIGYERSLFATFHGREEDIPAFYKIVEGMTPIK